MNKILKHLRVYNVNNNIIIFMLFYLEIQKKPNLTSIATVAKGVELSNRTLNKAFTCLDVPKQTFYVLLHT